MHSMMEKACFCFIVFVIHMWMWGLDPSDASATTSRLLSIAHQQKQQIETIELLFNQKPEFQAFKLKEPPRFVMDLKDCRFDKVYETVEVRSPSIKRIRVSQLRKNLVRVIVDQEMSFPEPEFSTTEHPMGETILVTLSSPVKNSTAVVPKNDFVTENMGIAKSTTVQKDAEPIDHDETIKNNTNTAQIDNTAELDQESLESFFSSFDTDMPSQELAEKSSMAAAMAIKGYLMHQTAYRLKKPHQFSKIKTDLNFNLSARVSDNLSYVLGTRLSYDAVFDLTDNHNEDVESDQKKRLDLRDAYVDFSWGNAEFRIGNQQIVWGEAVGLFFADIVNPNDLREYILPDLDQIRIPVPAINLEYYPGNLYLQFVFIPYPEFNEFGKKGSEFDFSRLIYEQNADIVMKEAHEPTNGLDNSELGFRASKLIGGWDLSVLYLYDYYNFPVTYRYISFNPVGSSHPITLTYQPEYKRMHRFGYTFSKEYMDTIFKGEFIYNHEMFISSLNFSDRDGIIRSDTFKWLLGMDYTFLNSLETNFQLMQEVIMDYQKDMAQREYTTFLSIWMKKEVFDNKIELELFFISNLNQKDAMIRPKLTYNYKSTAQLTFGADIFWGEIDGDFGLFNENNRVYIEVLYSF